MSCPSGSLSEVSSSSSSITSVYPTTDSKPNSSFVITRNSYSKKTTCIYSSQGPCSKGLILNTSVLSDILFLLSLARNYFFLYVCTTFPTWDRAASCDLPGTTIAQVQLPLPHWEPHCLCFYKASDTHVGLMKKVNKPVRNQRGTSSITYKWITFKFYVLIFYKPLFTYKFSMIKKTRWGCYCSTAGKASVVESPSYSHSVSNCSASEPTSCWHARVPVIRVGEQDAACGFWLQPSLGRCGSPVEWTRRWTMCLSDLMAFESVILEKKKKRTKFPLFLMLQRTGIC